MTSLVSRRNGPNTYGRHRAFFHVDGRFGMSETDRSGPTAPFEHGLGGWCLSRARVVAGRSGFGENHIDVIPDPGVADDSRNDT